MITLPVPSLTATLLPHVGNEKWRPVVVHGSPRWQQRIANPRKGTHGVPQRCSACFGSGHNSRSKRCPNRTP